MCKEIAEQTVLDLDHIETYIAEHGQDQGTVSWQMAWDSIKRVRSLVGKARVLVLAEMIDEVSA